MFEATCHCGNIKIIANRVADSITQCNCSICHRLSALWAYYPASDVAINITDKSMESYLWGDKTMEYHRCNVCGCTTHYSTVEDGNPLVAVNCRMIDSQVIESIPVRYFDGAVSWRYLDT